MKSLAELQALRDRVKDSVILRQGDKVKYRIAVGMATCGIAAGARPVMAAFEEEVDKRGIDYARVIQVGCVGVCKFEPVVEVFEADGKKTTYVKMTADKVAKVIEDHIVNGKVVTEYTIGANM